MKSIVLVVFFVIGMACDTVKDMPDTSTPNISEKEISQSSDVDLPNQQTEIPGGIAFKVKVLETFDDKKNICGVSRSNVIEVEVIEIIESGSGITNMPNKKDVILVNFLLAPKNLNTDSTIEAKAKESLCPDASNTFFTINSFEILE